LATLGIVLVGVFPQPFIDLATRSIQMLAATF